MKSISREDYGYYKAPIDWDEVQEERENKEIHDELEWKDKKEREGL